MTTARDRRAAEAAPLATDAQAAADAAGEIVSGTVGDHAALERPETAADRLGAAPAISRITPAQFALIKRTVAVNASDADVGWFLELAARYDLDPFAREVWLARGESRNGREGRLLIMVGRDGLRKIANRNGLEIQGDVVCEKDEFWFEWVDGHYDNFRLAGGGGMPYHRVHHKAIGIGDARGPIVGAWARVVERRTKIERGWATAGRNEYDRSKDAAGGDPYNPWNRQLSTMLLGALERQAIRQATPLGGLLVDGEERLVDARTDAEVPRGELDPEVEGVLQRARSLGHVGLSDAETAVMATAGRQPLAVSRWVAQAHAELDAFEASKAEGEPADAVVVGEPNPDVPVEAPSAPRDGQDDADPEGATPKSADRGELPFRRYKVQAPNHEAFRKVRRLLDGEVHVFVVSEDRLFLGTSEVPEHVAEMVEALGGTITEDHQHGEPDGPDADAEQKKLL